MGSALQSLAKPTEHEPTEHEPTEHEPIALSILRISGDSFEVTCDTEDTIDQLKINIFHITGVFPCQQFLMQEHQEVFQGRLGEHGISCGTTLTLAVRAYPASGKWRVRNADQLTDHWNIGELCMMDTHGQQVQPDHVICSCNYTGVNLSVVHDGDYCTIGHACRKTWAGSDTPSGQAVGGSWLGFEFTCSQCIRSVRMAQGGDRFPGKQGVRRVWLEAWINEEWQEVGELIFEKADDTSVLQEPS